MATKKIINNSIPDEGGLGQMNIDDETLLQSGIGDLFHLYTTRHEYDYNEDNIETYPSNTNNSWNDGLNWMSDGSEFKIINAKIVNRGVNMDVVGGGWAAYVVDDAMNPDIASAESGNAIRDAVGGTNEANQNDWDESYAYLYHKSRGTINSGGSIGEIIEASNCTNCHDDLTISDFPKNFNTVSDEYTAINGDMEEFSKDMGSGNSAYHVVIRMAGDAEDYGPNDSRNRSYNKYTLRKTLLKDMWMQGENFENSHDGGNYEVFCWGKGVGDSVGQGLNCTHKVGPNTSTVADNYNIDDSDEWEDVTAAAFKCQWLAVKVTPPTWKLSEAPKDIYFGENWYRGIYWINELDNNDYIKIRPDNWVDYTFLYTDSTETEFLDPNHIFDFRPVSHISVTHPDDEDPQDDQPGDGIDIQSFYEPETTEFQYSVAPNVVRLQFKMSYDYTTAATELNYFTYNAESNLWVINDINPDSNSQLGYPGDIGFKMVVVDWEAEDSDFDFDDILFDWPQDYTEMNNLRQLKNTYHFKDVYDKETETYNSLYHQYNTAGYKIIKALVFSYIKHSNDQDLIQALRWKGVVITHHLAYSSIDMEDFGLIGGPGYTFLPWPYTTPIVGGISNDSQYINSVENILGKNYFKETEYNSYFQTLNSWKNKPGSEIDELGKYPGKIDFGQLRYFNNGNFDMNNLLGISSNITDLEDGSIFHPYNDFNHWQGDPCQTDENQDYLDQYFEDLYECTNLPTYPQDSCVGLIFIEDSMRTDLKNACKLELSVSDIDNGALIDTSLGDKKGILIGDYSLEKRDYLDPVAKTSEPIVPEIDDVDSPPLKFVEDITT
tara:strand:- start:10043 stop:12538 length:2496 start_codon:yes stop_codon:yes gene_type:complete